MTLRELCIQKIGLQEADILTLENIERNLSLIAELTGSDIFIDCRLPDNTVIVVAEAKPLSIKSTYTDSVVGMVAKPQDEPAVHNAFSSGIPVRDLKALTQEKRSVSQNVVPIYGSNNSIIAVLIRETDISQTILLNKKYKTLTLQADKNNEKMVFSSSADKISTDSNISLMEVHHRIKNSLQLVASMLNIQARRSSDSMKIILHDSVNKILCISAVHDILSMLENENYSVSCHLLFRELIRNYTSLTQDICHIDFYVTGEDILLSADNALSISIAVNEIITNSIKHAFKGRDHGKITINTVKGNYYCSISVEDDGVGFSANIKNDTSAGLSIVSAAIEDKLKGKLRYITNSNGTSVRFDFINDAKT